MSKKTPSIEEIIKAAVTAAFEVAERNIDEKLKAAVEMGAKIGAATGAEVGAKSAVRAIEREKKRYREKQYDRRYHNTKLLLRNYRHLNEHFKNAVFDIEQAEELDETFVDIMDLMNSKGYDDSLYVESIKASSIKTKIIMTHVNRMLEIYGMMCERSNREDERRRYRILKALYLDDNPVTAIEIAQQEQIDKRTVYRDIDSAAASLTTLLYGVGGIEKP